MVQKYCCYIKYGTIITNLSPWNPWGILLICHDTIMRVYGAWIIIYYVSCSKTYGTFSSLFWCPAGSRRAARGARTCENCLLLSCIPWKGNKKYEPSAYLLGPVIPFCQTGAVVYFSNMIDRPIAQIPQCTNPICHNVPFYYRCYMCLMHCGICEMGLFILLFNGLFFL